MQHPLLTVEGLQIQFKQDQSFTTAVNDLDFFVNPKETLAIVGESGSGKTVSCLSLLQLLPKKIATVQSSKSTFYLEETPLELHQLNDTQIRKIRGKEIAMIFQEPMTSLNPVFTCGNQVMEAVRLHLNYDKKTAKAYVLSLFEKVQLPQPNRIFEAYPHQISGGQMQRVMIAMAIACKPKLLIADEPTTALDVTVQHKVLDLMQSLQDEMDMSILFITHDLGVVAQIADRVLVMQKGQKVEEGITKSVFLDAKAPYTNGLIACRPPLKEKPKRLLTVEEFLDTEIHPEPEFYSANEINAQQEALLQKETLLSIKNLTKRYALPSKLFSRKQNKPFTLAVDNVSLDIRKGETLGLVGESGCGKTTLGKSILQLIPFEEGEVIFDGKNIAQLSSSALKKVRKDFQIIFQDPYSALNPRRTIGKSITEPMEVHNTLPKAQREDRMASLLELVGLSADYRNRYPHQFSGGQRQRICIARALATHPKFIVCDESVSALDVSVQAQVLNLLMELKEEFDFTNIFISHDLSVVKCISDRIAVMKAGQIVEYGFANEIYNHPKEIYTQQLIEAIPKVPW